MTLSRSSSRLIPRAPRGAPYLGQDMTIWSAVCSSAPHSQAAVAEVPHLCNRALKRPTPDLRRFSLTHAILGREAPGGEGQPQGWNRGDGWENCANSMFQTWLIQCAALDSWVFRLFKRSWAIWHKWVTYRFESLRPWLRVHQAWVEHIVGIQSSAGQAEGDLLTA